MILPFATNRSTQPEAQAQIDRTLYLLQNVHVPGNLNERVESRLAVARLRLAEKASDHELGGKGGSSSFWYPMRIAA